MPTYVITGIYSNEYADDLVKFFSPTKYIGIIGVEGEKRSCQRDSRHE
jgi:hypothetical protein